MKLLIHRRPAVLDPSREKHCFRFDRSRAPGRAEAALGLVQPGYIIAFDAGAVLLRLLPHQLHELLAANPVRIARMIACARYAFRAALAVVDDERIEMEARKIDGGGQPRRSAADDQAVEWFVHAAPNGL